jgi:hypothetical protein
LKEIEMNEATAREQAQKEDGCPPGVFRCEDFINCTDCWAKFIMKENEK